MLSNQFRFNVKVEVRIRNRVRKCLLTLNGGSQGRNIREEKSPVGGNASVPVCQSISILSRISARGTARPTASLACCFCFRSRACVSRDWTELFACGPVTGGAVRRARRAIISARSFHCCVSSSSRTVLGGRSRAEMGLLYFSNTNRLLVIFDSFHIHAYIYKCL